MKSSQITQGETYMFVATDSPARKHLEGEPFTVVEIKSVWRRLGRSKRVKRFFNEAGEGARADELEPLDDFKKLANDVTTIADAFMQVGEAANDLSLPEREWPCSDCATGEMIITGTTPGRNETTTHYQCNECGHKESFP